MIIRVFVAKTRSGANVKYERMIREQAMPLMQSYLGLAALHAGKSLENEGNEFVMVSVWRDLASLKAFTGDNWQQSVVLPGEAELVEHVVVNNFEAMG